jgi:hypothetical protein
MDGTVWQRDQRAGTQIEANAGGIGRVAEDDDRLDDSAQLSLIEGRRRRDGQLLAGHPERERPRRRRHGPGLVGTEDQAVRAQKTLCTQRHKSRVGLNRPMKRFAECGRRPEAHLDDGSIAGLVVARTPRPGSRRVRGNDLPRPKRNRRVAAGGTLSSVQLGLRSTELSESCVGIGRSRCYLLGQARLDERALRGGRIGWEKVVVGRPVEMAPVYLGVAARERQPASQALIEHDA